MSETRRLDLQIDYWNNVGPTKPFAHPVNIEELSRWLSPAGRILDYGCGKGYQYLARRVHETWGGVLPHCYDVGIKQFSRRPEGVFEGIICTDMMEHIDEPDVDSVLADVFGFAAVDRPAFAFLAISCAPSKKRDLPDGRNVHLTVQPPAWWAEKIARFERSGLILQVVYEDCDGRESTL